MDRMCVLLCKFPLELFVVVSIANEGKNLDATILAKCDCCAAMSTLLRRDSRGQLLSVRLWIQQMTIRLLGSALTN